LVFIITAAIISGLPGALIALAPRPLYPAHAAGVAAWGLTLLEDQQLAGIVMWIPGGLIYLVAAAGIFVRWVDTGEPVPRVAASVSLARPASLLSLAVLTLSLLGGCNEHEPSGDVHNGIGDISRGRALVATNGCGACHRVPGVADADGEVGPPLTRIGRRIYIAGVLRNTPDNMQSWLQDPQRIVPGNVMPNMHLSARDARDIAAFLFSVQ
jgi:cytochrome c2